jgi:hypothetical protein
MRLHIGLDLDQICRASRFSLESVDNGLRFQAQDILEDVVCNLPSRLSIHWAVLQDKGFWFTQPDQLAVG